MKRNFRSYYDRKSAFDYPFNDQYPNEILIDSCFISRVLLKKNITTGYFDDCKIEFDEQELKPIAFYNELSNTVNAKSIVPENWLGIIKEIFSEPIPSFSGTLSKLSFNSESFFDFSKINLEPIDITTLEAVQKAMSLNQPEIHPTSVSLYIGNGIKALFTFRKQGEVITTLHHKPVEICVNKLTRGRTVNHRLHEIFQVTTPGAYYLLYDKYVIELVFEVSVSNFSTLELAHFNTLVKEHERDLEEEYEREKREDDDFFTFYAD